MNNPNSQDLKFIIPIMILDAILRGLALWKSAKSNKKWWFIALFLINSAGILPAVYLFLNRQKAVTAPTTNPSSPDIESKKSSSTPKLLASKVKSKKTS